MNAFSFSCRCSRQKHPLLVFCLLIFLASCQKSGHATANKRQIDQSAPRAHITDEILVKVRTTANLNLIFADDNEISPLKSGVMLQKSNAHSWIKIKVRPAQNLATVLERLRKNPQILSAELNYIYKPFSHSRVIRDALRKKGVLFPPSDPKQDPPLATPPPLPSAPAADPLLSDEYGLQKIKSIEAWEKTQIRKGALIAHVDSGADYTHPDLVNNLWRNPKEIPGNGIDDDNNGFVDDIIGWDFLDGDNLPFDWDGHGTHTAGIIAATGQNGIGISGVIPHGNLMIIRFMGENNEGGSVGDAILAINYAINQGAKIISCSWGGAEFSNALYDTINEAAKTGVLFVAAAGNESSDIDAVPVYPAGFDSANIVSVMATDESDAKAEFSNTGVKNVDLAAPGVDILSTIPFAEYLTLSGTSMSTPFVSGSLGLLMGAYPNLGSPDFKALVLDSTDKVAGLNGLSVTGGRLNLVSAFDLAASRFGPPQPTP